MATSTLDRFIAWLSPERGARRLAARVAIRETERLLGYDRTKPTARSHRNEGSGASADYKLELGQDRRTAVDQARQLECNNSLAGSLLDRAVEHIVGEGFKVKFKTDDEKWNDLAEEYWRAWCGRADSRGILTFTEILSTVVRSWLRDGDVGVLLERDGTLRLVESDEIASRVGGYYKASDADGVELDRRGRIVAYHVFDYDPTVLWPDRRRAVQRLVRVPAEDMIFLARRQRGGQTRGMSAFNGIQWILETLDDALEAKAVQETMAACLGLIIQRKTPIGGTGNDPNRPELKLGPGKVMRTDPGEEVFQVQPAQSPGFEPLSLDLKRAACARFGVTLESVWFNFDKSNYSNMRGGSLESTRSTRIKQNYFCTNFVSEVVVRKTVEGIRSGELPPRRDAHKHVVGVPGSQWVDPEAELSSAMGSVDGCLDTRRAILARRGLDLDEVLDELEDEEKKIKARGLTVTRSTLTREVVPVRETITEEGGGGARKKPAPKPAPAT